jgi:hypothetical protein
MAVSTWRTRVPTRSAATRRTAARDGTAAAVGGTLAFADGHGSIDDGNVSGYVTDGKFVNVDTPLEANVNILAVW